MKQKLFLKVRNTDFFENIYFGKNENQFFFNYLNFYLDVAIKSKNLGISVCIKHAFWPFLDYGFNAASKFRRLGFN